MQPDFRIIADAQDITEVIRDRLLSLRLTDESGTQSDALEIQLDDRDAVINMVPLPNPLQVTWFSYQKAKPVQPQGKQLRL